MLFARSPQTPLQQTPQYPPTPQTPQSQHNPLLSPDNDTTNVAHRWGHSSMMPVDDDCLPEVRQFSDLEVPTHHPLGAIPEAVNHDALPEVKSHIAISNNPTIIQPPRSQPTSRPPTASQTAQPATNLPPRPGPSKRRLWIVLGSALALLIATIALALGLGLGLGLGKKNNDPTTSSTTNTPPPSTCQNETNRVFRRTLAAGIFNGSIHIFSRSRKDSNIWFRSWKIKEGGDQSATWTTEWDTLAEGPGMELHPFTGAPTVITSPDGSRMDVFATGTMSGNVNTISFTKSNRAKEWGSLGGFGLSSIAVCNSPMAENSSAPTYDMWMLGKNSTSVIKNTWDTSRKIGNWDEESIPTLRGSGTSPAVICSKHDPKYTVFTFAEETNDLQSTRFNSSSNNIWSPWNNWAHKFRGDPVAISVDEGRQIYFFGVGANSNMYHFTWEDGIDPEPRSIGGNWTSIPSAVVVNAGTKDEQVHIVALDEERKLRHRAFGDFGGGRKWQATRWEELNVKGNSAPLVFTYLDTKGKEQIGLAMLDDDNQLLFATWPASNDTLWKKYVSFGQSGGELANESVCI